MHPFNIILNLCELLALFTGIAMYRKTQFTQLKNFTFLLGFIVCSEIIGKLYILLTDATTNKPWYDYFVIPIVFVAYYLGYRNLAASSKDKKVASIACATYLAVFVLEIILKRKDALFSFSYVLGTLLLLIVVLRYLFQCIQSDDIVGIKLNPYFYISIGLLMFYIGTFPFYGLKNYLWTSYKVIGQEYWYVAMTLNCIMYCMFTYSFICSKQKSILL
jgi:hypothetical protein